MKGHPDGVHNFSVTQARAHAHARDLVGVFWGVQQSVHSCVIGCVSPPRAARMRVSYAENRVQLWATPWKSCEKEHTAVSVIDEQTSRHGLTHARKESQGGVGS